MCIPVTKALSVTKPMIESSFLKSRGSKLHDISKRILPNKVLVFSPNLVRVLLTVDHRKFKIRLMLNFYVYDTDVYSRTSLYILWTDYVQVM